jgi:hypothetical protein
VEHHGYSDAPDSSGAPPHAVNWRNETMECNMCAKLIRPTAVAEADDPEISVKRNTSIRKSTSRKRTAPEFDRLAESAFDFLNRGLKEVKKEPKYSIIDFFTGIELLLKARLLHEHWSLMVAKPGETSRQKFLAGDFESATRKQCFERLQNVCGEFLSREKGCFDELADHRNRVVHFYHVAYSGDPKQKLLEDIVIQQLRAGAFLLSLLRRTWKVQFSSHAKEINAFERALHNHKHFLKAKYEVVRPDIEKVKKEGGIVWICDTCGMEAREVEEQDPPLKTSRCLVCESSRSHIHIDCPECKEGGVEFDVDKGSCDNCEKDFDLTFLISEFAQDGAVAYCPECEYIDEHSVIEYGSEYLCLTCGATFYQIDECEFCNEHIAGELVDSYLDGCLLCDGRLGWEADRD